MATRRLVASLFALTLVACSGEDAPPDAAAGMDATAVDVGAADATVDAGVAADATVDAGLALDAATDAGAPEDAAAPDAGPDLVGTITGACGELDEELTSGSPSTFVNTIDFPNGFDEAMDATRLTEGAQEVLRDGNAGGSSVLSEVFAYEVLARCEGAALRFTETEVEYDPMQSKKTDVVVDIDGVTIGVSVTRAVGFPQDDPWPVSRAQALLEDKLADILESSANVVPAQAWTKQILHVIAYGPMHAESLMAAEAMVPASVRADTILWITVTDGDDLFLY